MAYATPRTYDRYPVHVRVGMSSHILQGLKTADLSLGGVALQVPQPIPVQSAIVVAFDDEVRVNATVKHCTKGSDGFRVGAQFGALTARQRAALDQLIGQVRAR